MSSAADFSACLAYVLDLDATQVPVPDASDPFVAWRGWLAARGFGLVPIADPAAFSWPGFWIGRVGARWAVMFGVPSGPVFPVGLEGEVEAGYVVAPLELSARRAQAADAPGTGRVESIFVADRAEGPMRARDTANASTEGLVGDRYAAGAGTFSNPHATGTALTLVEAEVLESVGLAPDEARRNVVTRGVALNALVGRSFRVGEVECLGRRFCEPCAHWQRLTRPGVLRAFVHRGGLRADVVVPGVIRRGDEVTAT